MSEKPDWWRENERVRASLDLPGYEPPRFADGTHTHEVVGPLEQELGVEIRFLAVEPRGGRGVGGPDRRRPGADRRAAARRRRQHRLRDGSGDLRAAGARGRDGVTAAVAVVVAGESGMVNAVLIGLALAVGRMLGAYRMKRYYE